MDLLRDRRIRALRLGNTESQRQHQVCWYEPFIVAEVLVRKLLQQRPLHHPLGSFVLQEVDKHMLQPGVALRRRGLFGQ